MGLSSLKWSELWAKWGELVTLLVSSILGLEIQGQGSFLFLTAAPGTCTVVIVVSLGFI